MGRCFFSKEKFIVLTSRMFLYFGVFLRFCGKMIGLVSAKRNFRTDPRVLIEAGERGWDSIFFEELEDSLIQYLPDAEVERSVIKRDKGYVMQSLINLWRVKPTHFCIDPRSGAQTSFRPLIDATILSLYLGLSRITPIVILTDGSIRLWRYQAIILTGSTGVIVTFIDATSMGNLFPHCRIIGPSIMPISSKRLSLLRKETEAIDDLPQNFNDIYFLGSLYPQRLEILDKLNTELIRRKSKAHFTIEEKSGDITAEEYWAKLGLHSSLITTTQQQPSSMYKMDRTDINQMVFRVSEALAARKLLYCTEVPGIENYFTEGIHFIGFKTYADAVDKIQYFASNPNIASSIAREGGRRFRELVEKNTFWEMVNLKLDKKLVPLVQDSSATR
jgi:hypothetical protein